MRTYSIHLTIVGMMLFYLGCSIRPGAPASIQGSFFNIDTTSKYPELPGYPEVTTWKGSGWRGERISTQLVVWSPEHLDHVHISVSDFTAPDRQSIRKEQIQLRTIQTVMTDEFAEGCEKSGIENYDSSMVADALLQLNPPLDIDPDTPQWLWITIQIPHETEPGIYTGSITLSQERRYRKTFHLEVEVLAPELPPPDQWTYHLDLWQNPFAEARISKTVPWSESHFEIMRPTLEMLADAGQKCITTVITDLPWNGQTYDPFLSMVSRVKHADGTWYYDYTVFDAWVEFAMECGITDQINCYSMVTWSNQYSFYDEASGKKSILECKPGSQEYKQFWIPFLTDFYRHLKAKGWENITTISMDERSLEDLNEVLHLVHSGTPGLKIAFAGHYHPELDHELYDISVASKHVIPENNLYYRKEAGFKTTFYVCCVEAVPNTFTFSHAAEATYLSWYAAYRKFDGMLRWSYNSWTKDPFKDSRFRRFPAGDTYMVYPGGISSVRFERLIEGIQDYEKIRILRSTLNQNSTFDSEEKLKRLNNLLATFQLENLNHQSAAEAISQGKALLTELSQ